jgi:hypothetical protein
MTRSGECRQWPPHNIAMLLPVLISPRSPLHGFLASTTERHAGGRNMGRMGRRRSSCAY